MPGKGTMSNTRRADGIDRKRLSPELTPALVAQGQPDALALQREDERKLVRGKGRPKKTTRDAILALQHQKFGKAAGRILTLVIDAALDPEHKMHAECLRMCVERIAPVKFWTGLAELETAPEGGGGAQMPQFNVFINGGSVQARPFTPDDPDIIDV